jgi:hypothetical protein
MTAEVSNAPETDEEIEYPPFMSPTAIRRRSVAVVVMGLILLVGFATLVGLIIYKSGKAKEAEIARRAPAIVSPAEAQRVYNAEDVANFVVTTIPKGARITNTSVDGNRVYLTIEDGNGSSVMLLDTDTWKIVGIARFSHDEGK